MDNRFNFVDAAQTLLKQQFPHIQSLQNVTKGMTMSFYIQTGAFVQILHSDGHWFTVSSSGGSIPTVKVFDSMYGNGGGRIHAPGKASHNSPGRHTNEGV